MKFFNVNQKSWKEVKKIYLEAFPKSEKNLFLQSDIP